MDRAWSPAAFHPPAVRTARTQPFDLALSAGTGLGRRPAADAFDRRAVSASAILRLTPDDVMALRTRRSGEPQARTTVDAADGNRSHLSTAADHVARRESSCFSVSATWRDNPTARSRLVQR